MSKSNEISVTDCCFRDELDLCDEIGQEVLESSPNLRKKDAKVSLVKKNLLNGIWKSQTINGNSLQARFFNALYENDKQLVWIQCKQCETVLNLSSRSAC